MKHWSLDDIAWSQFAPDKVDPNIVALVKAAAMVEHNGLDYAVYLNNVFNDDPDFRQAANYWAQEEVQHGKALGRWATIADPSWNFDAAFARFKAGYTIPLDALKSVRGSRTGELIARCMVETGTSSYYTALSEATDEPVLKQICHHIAADEFRHFKLFYDHMRRYLSRERIGMLRRLRIAVGRISESEDDELAFAFYCSNELESVPYHCKRYSQAYMAKAIGFYRFRHVERGIGMIFKTVGLPPRGKLSDVSAHWAWRLLARRHRRYLASVSERDRSTNSLPSSDPMQLGTAKN